MPAGTQVAVLRYHEIALKGRNRPFFVRQLAEHVAKVTAGLPVGPVGRASARLVLPLREPDAWPAVRARLERVFGLANLSLAHELPLRAGATPEAALVPIADLALARLEGQTVPSFRVLTKRCDKQFPLTSPEISRLIGGRIKEATGAPVDLRAGAVTVAVDVLRARAFVSLEKVGGAGGLPVGTSGLVLALLSGGIDSPVAAWRMMRRGCRVDFVHFHSAPFLDRTGEQKARELARQLVAWELEAVLHVVAFGEVQRQIVAAVRRPLRVVLYRRMMLRIATAIARRTGALALVTGESLGQVASQTLPNVAAIDTATELPVLRPLIGMDKGEIAAQAERIGTFETSIVPDQDCCQLFVPRHPSTRAQPEEVAEAEARFDVEGLVLLALDGVERTSLRYPDVAVEDRSASSAEAG
jgi:thiamine biosynthesis protein ThiI